MKIVLLVVFVLLGILNLFLFRKELGLEGFFSYLLSLRQKVARKKTVVVKEKDKVMMKKERTNIIIAPSARRLVTFFGQILNRLTASEAEIAKTNHEMAVTNRDLKIVEGRNLQNRVLLDQLGERITALEKAQKARGRKRDSGKKH